MENFKNNKSAGEFNLMTNICFTLAHISIRFSKKNTKIENLMKYFIRNGPKLCLDLFD